MKEIRRCKNRMNFHVLITHILTPAQSHIWILFRVCSCCDFFSFCSAVLSPLNLGVVSELLWYVVWRWFYVHTIDYAKQFMVCVWIDDNDANWFVAIALHIFLFTLLTFDMPLISHCICFIFFIHSLNDFLFQIISIKMTKNEQKPKRPHSRGWMYAPVKY